MAIRRFLAMTAAEFLSGAPLPPGEVKITLTVYRFKDNVFVFVFLNRAVTGLALLSAAQDVRQKRATADAERGCAQ